MHMLERSWPAIRAAERFDEKVPKYLRSTASCQSLRPYKLPSKDRWLPT